MKKIIFGVLFILLCLFFDGKFFMLQACAQDAPVGVDVRVSSFYNALQPYGEWILDDTYGWVWSPYNIPIHWRPYTDGHWVDTDQGWTWVSDQPWGGVCFHYGRWFYEKNHGWLWYPDTVWAPAWVVWRSNDDMIGWAPLPPRAVWRRESGLEFSGADAERISWHAYNFCYARDFTAADLSNHFIEHARNVTIMKEAGVVADSIRTAGDRVVIHAPFHEMVVKAIGHSKSRLTISDVKSLERSRAAPAKSAPVELTRLHQSESAALQAMHKKRQRTLEEEHAKEIKNPPKGRTKEQLLEQHKNENNAMQEQMARERQLLQSQHAQETRLSTLSKAQYQRHIVVPAPQAHDNGKGKNGQGDKRGVAVTPK